MRPSLHKTFLLLLFLPALAGAQVFRCADATGKVQFSDRPCAAGEKSGEVRIYASPAAPAPAPAPAPVQRMNSDASAYEKTRQQRRQQSDDSHQRIDDATARVQKMRSENYDPRKCAEARERLESMERRDPLMYKINPDYGEFQQKASLYCGN